jgi:hypothetical protein
MLAFNVSIKIYNPGTCRANWNIRSILVAFKMVIIFYNNVGRGTKNTICHPVLNIIDLCCMAFFTLKYILRIALIHTRLRYTSMKRRTNGIYHNWQWSYCCKVDGKSRTLERIYLLYLKYRLTIDLFLTKFPRIP